MDFQADALKFLETKSVSEEGNEEAINFLIPFFENMGAKLVLQQVPHSLRNLSKRQFNLLAILGDDLVDSRTKKGLLLTSPVDTCGVGNASDWVKLGGEPFKPKFLDGKFYGLGAANSKLNFLAMVKAASEFSRQKFVQPLYLAATCGGESALAGAKYLIQSGAVNPKSVMVARPTGLRLVNLEKTQIVYKVKLPFVAFERDAQEFNAKIFVTSKSKGKHISVASAGNNCLNNVLFFLENIGGAQIENKLLSLQANASLNRVSDLATVGIVVRSKDLDTIRDRFRSIASNHRDHHYEMRLGGTGEKGIRLIPEDVRMAIKKIKEEISEINAAIAVPKSESFGDHSSSVLLTGVEQERDFLELTVAYQLLPELSDVDSRKELERDFKDRLNRIASSFKSIAVEVRREHQSGQYGMAQNSTFVTTLRSHLNYLGVDSHLSSSLYATGAGHFVEKGYDTVAFGAGVAPDGINCPDENVDLGDLQSAIRFYSQCIDAFCFKGA